MGAGVDGFGEIGYPYDWLHYGERNIIMTARAYSPAILLAVAALLSTACTHDAPPPAVDVKPAVRVKKAADTRPAIVIFGDSLSAGVPTPRRYTGGHQRQSARFDKQCLELQHSGRPRSFDDRWLLRKLMLLAST